MNIKRIFPLPLIISFFMITGFAITGCNSLADRKTESIIIDGSGTVFPITEAVAEEFLKENRNIKVTVGAAGSGAGFKKFARGETDIATSSRRIKEEEIAACKQNNVSYYELPVALDGIAIVVNAANNWAADITVEELKKLWEPNSNIKKWSEIRNGWPAEEIRLYGPNTAHGTYDFFTEVIMGESGASRADYSAVADYNVAVRGVASDKYALGYFGLAYYEENKDKLKLVAVDNGTGAVLPTLETIKNGTYAPLSRQLLIYISKNAALKPGMKKFVEFFLNNAATLSQEVGYIPLPAEEYEKGKTGFNQFSTTR